MRVDVCLGWHLNSLMQCFDSLRDAGIAFVSKWQSGHEFDMHIEKFDLRVVVIADVAIVLLLFARVAGESFPCCVVLLRLHASMIIYVGCYVLWSPRWRAFSEHWFSMQFKAFLF